MNAATTAEQLLRSTHDSAAGTGAENSHQGSWTCPATSEGSPLAGIEPQTDVATCARTFLERVTRELEEAARAVERELAGVRVDLLRAEDSPPALEADLDALEAFLASMADQLGG